MSQLIQQTMESSRYFDGNGFLECVCCDHKYYEHDCFCPKCSAPTSISKTVSDRGRPATFISVLGAVNAGKTVYMGMLLDMLSKGYRGMHGLPNNSLSVSVQQQTVSSLERQRFPEKTSNDVDQWKWMHCEFTPAKRRKQFDIISPDFAGEAIGFELDQPGTFPVVSHVIRKSRGFVLLVDSVRARDAGREEDFFALKVATYIHQARKSGSSLGRNKSKLPLAIVLTKCDSCSEAFEDPSAFASSNMPGFSSFLSQHFAKSRFFAASVVGASATLVDRMGRVEQVPFHVAPRGILEPIEWLISR